MSRNARWIVLVLGALALSGLSVWLLHRNESATPAGARTTASNDAFPADAKKLDLDRMSGNLKEQRAHLWKLFALLVRTDPAFRGPAFAGWFNEAEVFEPKDQPVDRQRVPFPGLPTGSSVDVAMRLPHSADAPVTTFVHYNTAAFRHIREQRLFLEAQLQDLSRTGLQDPDISGTKTIPSFPREAVIVMTAWWPVGARGITPMPVWDPGAEARVSGGNGYLSWRRAVAIDAGSPLVSEASEVAVEFAGNTFPTARRIGLERLHHIQVDAPLAARLMNDPGSRKAALIALGRPLEPGDYLALVGLHVMTKELRSGIWGTFWWHDRPEEGPFASGRPDDVAGVWKNYLMDVAYDAVLPLGADGMPKICFNPWFDAAFPDGGQGNGVKANCVNCHSRASYPRTDFLPVFRGPPNLADDPAFAAGRLRTGQVWSLANPARAAVPPK